MADFLLQGMWVDSVPFSDRGSGADQDLHVLYPVMPEDPSWLWIALLAGGDPNATSKNQLVVRPDPNSFGNPPLSPASSGQGLQYKWGMMDLHGIGGTLQLSQGLPPSGFFALSGFFGQHDAGHGNGLYGGMGRYAYVGSEMLQMWKAPASTPIWNDHGSGADDDGSVWRIEASSWKNNGWSCFVAQSGYDNPGELYPLLDLSKIDFNV